MGSAYYQPSGRIPLRALPLLVLHALGTLPAAWLYASFTEAFPPLLDIVIVVCGAIVLVFHANLAAWHSKVRNPAWMGAMGLVIGVACWYFQWTAWIALTSAKPSHPASAAFLDLVTHPAALFRALVDIDRTGTWGAGGYRLSGWTLATLWLGELFLFLYVPAMMAHHRAGEPFNETVDAWAEEITLSRKFACIEDAQAAAASLERNPDLLLSLLHPWYPGHAHATVTIHRCRHEDSYVSIINFVPVNDGGKPRYATTLVVDYLRLPGTDPDELLRALTETIPTPPERDDSPVPPISLALDSALTDLQWGRHEEVLAAASAHVDAADRYLRADAHRLRALANSSLERWDAACACWAALFEDEPTAHNALQMATSSVMAGHVDSGTSWLERARAINDTPQQLPGIAMDTNFMSALTRSGNAQAAMPYLDRLKDVYVSLANTDATFLFLRHVPRFDVFLENSVPILDASMGEEQKREWYASMLPHLDGKGKTLLMAWMTAQFQRLGTP